MAKYIDKDAVVAEIDKKYNREEDWLDKQGYTDYHIGLRDAYKNLRDLVGTLEVKEVRLDFQRFAKEMDFVFDLPSSETKNTEEEPLNWEYAIAKHFFALGMQASNPLTWEDISSLKLLLDEVENEFKKGLHNDKSYIGYCKEVLKRFKAQKGEKYDCK